MYIAGEYSRMLRIEWQWSDFPLNIVSKICDAEIPFKPAYRMANIFWPACQRRYMIR